MIKAIIFDLDGTILNTLQDIQNALSHGIDELFRTRDVKPLEDPQKERNFSHYFTLEETKSMVGSGLKNLVIQAIERIVNDPHRFSINKKAFNSFHSRFTQNKEKVLQECLDYLMDYYRKHPTGASSIYRGVNETIAELKTKGLKLGVLSNKAHELVLPIVDHFFPDQFSVVHGLKDSGPKKPDPACLKPFTKAWATEPEEMMMVGDSEADYKFAVNSDMNPVLVSYGYRWKRDLLKLNPPYLINSLKELLELLP